ncbi:MAG: glycosyltransferase family 4 protein, partial [Gammaproteobacteria bacterium]
MLEGAPPLAWTPVQSERASRSGPIRRPFGVNLAGYLTSEKGTGEAARSAAAILEAANVPLALNNIIDAASANVESAVREFANTNPYAFNLVYVNGDQAANFAFHKGKPYFDNRYNVGAWNWELTDFPSEWLPRFQYFDEVWVPTNFTRDALGRISPIPVTTVPYAVVPPQPTNFGRSHFRLPENDFVFLFMFDYHSVLERKNPLGLIEAFQRAFRPDEAAALVIKSSHADRRTVRMLRETARGSRIVITDTVLARDHVGALYKLCDCYVSLHRSEGFGLTPAEAMALGKPVIATGYGGNMDFMTEDNSYLVRYRLIELDRNYTPYQKGWVWADPDLDHAAELMRAVYEDRRRAKAVGKKAAVDISRLLGAEAVGRAM